ncbi:granzyme H-like isoform X4 [Equus przewalskii]|uniref:Granzyme H-like isoform X4 n=1 Tax=Equus przewalskii TaxID=9798 RepID=A0ABM4Q4G5_EQUPR
MRPLLLLLAFLLPPEAGTENIIRGHEAKPHSRPYTVFVQFLLENKKKRCGGVLVLEDFVLTAAHCRGRVINVSLGAYNIQKQGKTQQVMTVRQAICHPDYNPKNLSYDIMLLKIREQAKQTTAVRPLSLPRGKAQVNPRQVCSVAGWGKVSPADRVSDTLQDVELTVQKDHECYSHFTHHYNQAPQICVGDPKMMNNSFKGDSRGPLICNKLIQGIFSYGQNNRTPPGVFMKVSHFLPWIKSTMKSF